MTTAAENRFGKTVKYVAAGSACALLLFLAVFFGYRFHKNLIGRDKYKINMIVQIPRTEMLKTAYLAQILNLSQDRPVSYFSFSEKKALLSLLQNPLIKTAQVKKIRPSFVCVDYTVRKPCALLYDYPNMALDEEGFVFPLFPFFPPQNLPQIYLDLPELADRQDVFQKPLKNKNLSLAFELLQALKNARLQIKRIDTSQAFSKSYGKREIVLSLEEEIVKTDKKQQTVFVFPRILRLSCDDWAKQLGNYFELRKKMNGDYQKQLKARPGASSVYFKPKVIDLRISKLAFID